MSNKFTHLFVDTDVFGLHLYQDIRTGRNLKVRINNSEATIPISKEELDDIKNQILSNMFPKNKSKSKTAYDFIVHSEAQFGRREDY